MNDLLKLKAFYRGWILESGNEISDGNLYASEPPPPAPNVAIKLLQMESYQTLNNFTVKLQAAPTINQLHNLIYESSRNPPKRKVKIVGHARKVSQKRLRGKSWPKNCAAHTKASSTLSFCVFLSIFPSFLCRCFAWIFVICFFSLPHTKTTDTKRLRSSFQSRILRFFALFSAPSWERAMGILSQVVACHAKVVRNYWCSSIFTLVTEFPECFLFGLRVCLSYRVEGSMELFESPLIPPSLPPITPSVWPPLERHEKCGFNSMNSSKEKCENIFPSHPQERGFSRLNNGRRIIRERQQQC